MNGSEWCARLVRRKNFKNVLFEVKPSVELTRDETVQNIELKLENLPLYSDGFQSEILIGRFTYTDKHGNQNNSNSLVVKIFPPSSEESTFTEVTFANEIFVFNEVIPFLKTINSSISDLFPDFFYGCLDFNDRVEGCVMMENLRENHYRLPSSKVFLDIEHLILAMKKLGQFHAYSYAAKRKHPKIFYSLMDHLKESHPIVTRLVTGVLSPIVEHFLHLLSVESHYYNDKVRKIRQHVGDVEEYVIKIVDTKTEPNAVLCHGDFLRNNLMFKYDEKNTPVDLKFIDLANMKYCSPVVDLGLILYMNAEAATREEHWDLLIDTYYDSLKNTFPDESSVPSKDEILSEFKYTVLAPCFMVSGFLTWMLAIEESDNPRYVLDLFLPEYEEYVGRNFSSLPVDVHVNLFKKTFSPHREEKVLQNFRDIINRGFV